MTLRKWHFNHPERLIGDSVTYPILLTKKDNIKNISYAVEYFQWHFFSVYHSLSGFIEPSTVFTKRSVVSQIARIYDPLGMIGIVINTSKILLQKLWLLKIDWHEQLLPAAATNGWNLPVRSTL